MGAVKSVVVVLACPFRRNHVVLTCWYAAVVFHGLLKTFAARDLGDNRRLGRGIMGLMPGAHNKTAMYVRLSRDSPGIVASSIAQCTTGLR